MDNLETPDNEKINEENPFIDKPLVSLGQNALIYGSILGAINVVYSIVLWVFGQSMNKSLGYITFIFTVAIMYYGTKEYRDKHRGGYMIYGKAFTSNFLIGFYACIISTIYTFLLFKFIDPTLLTTLMETSIEEAMLKNPNLSSEQLEKSMSFFMTPVVLTLTVFIASTMYSTILGLIVAIFQKKEKPLF